MSSIYNNTVNTVPATTSSDNQQRNIVSPGHATLRSQSSFWEAKIRSNIGIVYLILSQLFNSVMITSTKLLETNPKYEKKIQPLQILLFRMFVTYIGTLVYMYTHRDTVPDVPFGAPSVRKWLVLRGLSGFCGVFGTYFSLMYLSISDSVLIGFLTPTITIFLAAWILKESLNRWEVVSSITSFIGVVLIIRPPFLFGVETDTSIPGDNQTVETKDSLKRTIATLVALFGTIGTSFVFIIIRFIGNRAHAIMSVSYFSLCTLIISLLGILILPGVEFLIPRSLKEWFLFFNLGFFGLWFQLLWNMGIQKEPAGRGSLIMYTSMIYALFWDFVLYHHWPPLWSWCGMFLIIGSTLLALKLKMSKQQNVSQDTTETTKTKAGALRPGLDIEADLGVELEEYVVATKGDSPQV